MGGLPSGGDSDVRGIATVAGKLMSDIFRDFSGRHVDPVVRMPQPQTLADLRRVIIEAEGQQLGVSAMGSAWAFSAPAYNPGVVVDTSRLSGFPAWLQECVIPPSTPSGEILAAVEAGIKIHNLYLALEGSPRADGGEPRPATLPAGASLPTLGGAGGQSLAGVINTGTHGGDVARPPIGDFVRACVLVGSGGVVRVVQRPGAARVVDVERLNAAHAAMTGGAAFEDYHEDGALEAVTLGLGRFGVVYAYVYALEDASNTLVLERRHRSTWSTESARLDAGSVVSDARSADGFLQIVMSAVRTEGEDRPCFVTEHVHVPRDTFDGTGTALGLPDVRSLGIELVRPGATMELVGQLFAVAEVTPEIRLIQTALRATALAAVGVASAVPVLGPVAALAAMPLAAALWDFADDLATINRQRLFGDVVADHVDAATGGMLNGAVVALMRTLIQSGQGDTRPDGQPWLFHGSRARVADFFDYRHDLYRGDSVEVFFQADASLTGHVQELLDRFEAMQNAGSPLGAYVSLRFFAPSSATLTTTFPSASESTCAIEVSMLRGLRANEQALREIQQTVVGAGGRVHWGQQNDLSPDEVDATMPRLAEWKRHLVDLEGSSQTFLTPFAHAHGLDVDQAVDWAQWVDLGGMPASEVAVAARAIDGRLPLVAVGGDGRVARSSIDASLQAEAWTPVRDEAMDSSTRPAVVVRSDDERLEIFARTPDSRLAGTYEQSRGSGTFAGWDVKTVPLATVPVTADFVLATMHDTSLEVFAREPPSHSRLLHCGTWGGGWGPLTPLDDLAVGSAVAVGLRAWHAPGSAPAMDAIIATVRAAGRIAVRMLGGNSWTILRPLPGDAPATTVALSWGRLIASSPAGVFEAVDGATASSSPAFGDWQRLPDPAPGLRRDLTHPIVAVDDGSDTWLVASTIRGEAIVLHGSNDRWGDWRSVGGSLTGVLAAGVPTAGTLIIVGRREPNRGLVAARVSHP